jgi:ribonuclease III
MIGRKEIEQIVGTKVKDISLYKTAFVHKSALSDTITECNERLEFIGDSVLSLIVTKHLFTSYPKAQEGFLTRIRIKLVSGPTLATFARYLQFNRWIVMDERGTEKGWNNNPKILEDVFEAIIGAIYLDIGLPHAREFVLRMINNPQVVDFKSLLIDTNYKDVITRHCQAKKWEAPNFVATQETNGVTKWFSVRLFIQGKFCGQGVGKSKRDAEQASSLVGLNTLKIPTQYIQ